MELSFHRSNDATSSWIVAYDKNTLAKVGVVTFHVREGTCYLDDVVVDQKFWRQGIATRLVLAAIAQEDLPYTGLRWGIRTNAGVALKRSIDRHFGKELK